MNKLLIDDYPIQVLPKLAELIGLNEAIVLQQIHYWLNNSKH
ncbi:TPA: DnaD domain protein, partial [Staphylococcus aureus]|nr:DnaD domain protein [Staphylococcus aureus]HDE8141824.1 DnaD domain protein [Staphylococcus aureus]HDF0281895.1 DnaD domain protein [Staphylococcus aureus]HDF3626348.1 DnaD domain protein [Staphylococcus aureus]HDL4735650.1 DnaD domain protein [Staphylococcus aureus]